MTDDAQKSSGPNGANAVIPCPTCGGGLKDVVDSRPGRILGLDVIRRRRVCQCCGMRTNTFEMRADEVENFVERRKKMKAAFASLVAVFSDGEYSDDNEGRDDD